FACQVKRIHEYKRQLLNVLHAIVLWLRLREGDQGLVPRTVIFAGKAAPGYAMAKLVIKLIHTVAERVAAEARAKGRLGGLFVPNYSASAPDGVLPAPHLPH